MKKRLDLLLTERGLCESRQRARTTIMSGLVYVNGQKEDKPGTAVPEEAELSVRENPLAYVSRGGLKLEKALDCFGVDVNGLRIIDAGASTGGFTDCLLQRGAAHVWAIDVGYGQLAWSLRNDKRVTVMERTNIRNVTPMDIGEPCDACVMDLSFISLRLVLPVVRTLLKPGADILCLIKPQFEAGREHVGKNGVVRDVKVHAQVLVDMDEYVKQNNFTMIDMSFSPVKGPKGNIEFLAHIGCEPNDSRARGLTARELAELAAQAHDQLRGDIAP